MLRVSGPVAGPRDHRTHNVRGHGVSWKAGALRYALRSKTAQKSYGSPGVSASGRPLATGRR